MPILEETLAKVSGVTGIRWHEPSQRFIAEIGYHEVSEISADGTVQKRRVRTTHYLGNKDNRAAYVSKFRSLKADWEGTVSEQRQQYDAEQARRRREGLPPLPRFKPNWPKSVVRATRLAPADAIAATAPAAPMPPVAEQLPAFAFAEATKRAEILNLTIKQVYERYVEQQRSRIGLLNGKGINRNTFEKYIQNLTLGLALNPTYSRPIRPIDVNKRLVELTVHDYELFVQFWCNPNNVKSERTAQNYTNALRRMLIRMKVPTPDEFKDIFTMKITQPTKIVRYNPDLLRIFLQHDDGRVRLLTLMCLNFGYYQVDIARLRFEHITDFEGNPYKSGEMFITKRRERTRHQNQFTTTIYAWPETQRQWVAAPIAKDARHLVVGRPAYVDGQSKKRYYRIVLRHLDPATLTVSQASELLRASAHLVLDHVYCQWEIDLDEMWQKLSETGQLDIVVTQRIRRSRWSSAPSRQSHVY